MPDAVPALSEPHPFSQIEASCNAIGSSLLFEERQAGFSRGPPVNNCIGWKYSSRRPLFSLTGVAASWLFSDAGGRGLIQMR